VRLTEAGERLYAAVRPALEDVRTAVAGVGELADIPQGTLRLHTSTVTETTFGGSLLAEFLMAHPHVRFDLVVSDAPVDIVAEGAPLAAGRARAKAEPLIARTLCTAMLR